MSNLSYIPLLNSIAVNEAKGEKLLQTWADTTTDAKLKATLQFVAIREGEHAKSFTKRMCELGYEVDEKNAYQVFKDFDGLLACAASDATDAEKVAMVTGGNGGGAGPVPRLLQRHHHRSGDRRAARPLHRRGAGQRSASQSRVRPGLQRRQRHGGPPCRRG